MLPVRRSTLCAVCFFMISLSSVHAVCPESDNPLNIEFEVPKEILCNGTTVDVEPIGIELFEPEDVACEENHDNITPEQFRDAITCEGGVNYIYTCKVKPECTAHRKSYLQRLKQATLRVLDEAVLKIKGITFFNKYPGTKQILFGNEPMGKLSGVDMVRRATASRFNVITGFAVMNKPHSPSLDDFDEEFGEAIELYVKLMALEPTGRLRQKDSLYFGRLYYLDYTEKRNGWERLLNYMKGNDFDDNDKEFAKILQRSLDLSISYLSGGKKNFPSLKIPFTGPCVSNDGYDPSSSYAKYAGIIEALKSRRNTLNTSN